eukprot:scaffold14974_cov195-Amphora_coffeaeformis.AAC.52
MYGDEDRDDSYVVVCTNQRILVFNSPKKETKNDSDMANGMELLLSKGVSGIDTAAPRDKRTLVFSERQETEDDHIICFHSLDILTGETQLLTQMEVSDCAILVLVGGWCSM